MAIRKRKNSLKFKPKNFVPANNNHQDQKNSQFTDHYQWDQQENLIQQLGANDYDEATSISGIYSCLHNVTQEKRAVKIVEKAKYDENFNQQLRNEFEVLKELDHPNILRVYESFETQNVYYMVTEICEGGELLDVIEEGVGISEDKAALVMKQLLTCINYCHQHSIVHLDLKPENILLDGFDKLEQMKVIDFGNAISVAQAPEDNKELDGLFGTPAYMSPEIVESELYGPKADIWACGIIAYYLLTGSQPYDSDNDYDLLEEIKYEPLSFSKHESSWEKVSSEALHFVQTLLNSNFQERPTAEQALLHPWIQEASQRSAAQFLDQNNSTNKNNGLIAAALENMKHFNPKSKVQEATMAFISAQLILKEEKDEIGSLFRVMDMDNDGKLSLEDLQMGFRKYTGEDYDVPEEEIQALFERCDLDGSGFIDYSEFAVAAIDETSLLTSKKVEEAFHFFDADGDGVVSSSDLAQVFQDVFADETEEKMDDKQYEEYIAREILANESHISLEDFSVSVVSATVTTVAEAAAATTAKPINRISGILQAFEGQIETNEQRGFDSRPF